MSKRILVTGGAGFVGSSVAKQLLAEGHDVLLVDDMSFGNLDNIVEHGRVIAPLHVLDIRDPRLFDLMIGVDTVLHFAGIAPLPVCQEDPRRAFDVNTAGTGQVLEAARRASVRRVIFSSTSAVYENSMALPHRVVDSVAPDLTYAVTKYSAELLCRSYALNYGLDIIVSRFFNVYGPHQDIHRASPPFTSYVAKELVNGRSPVLFNKSDSKRDYVHADDVASLLGLMIDSNRSYAADVFNIGFGEAYSVPELFSRFQAISGSVIEPTYREPTEYWDKYPVLFAGRGLDRQRVSKEVFKNSLADISASTREFGWVPKVDIEAGLRSVYEYARAHVVAH